MEENIAITLLNDFLFCPYSIYLKNIYKSADEELYHAAPQIRGKFAHSEIDMQKSNFETEIVGISVYSDELGLTGKIDIYKTAEKHLIEHKYKLEKVYLGQIYQIWGQYFCMKEMGYAVDKLSFYAISTDKFFPVDLPNQEDKTFFLKFIEKFRNYNPEDKIDINPNKCKYCIYNSLCDKAEVENVY